MPLNKSISILLLLFGYNIALTAQNTPHNARLINGKDTLLINDILEKEMFVSYSKDSVYERIGFGAAVLDKDSLVLNFYSYHYTNYKKSTSHSFMKSYMGAVKEDIKVPVDNVDYIKRETWIKGWIQPFEVITGLVGFVVAPIISLGRPFKTNIYYPVAGIYISAFIISLAIDNMFGYKKYYTKLYKRKKVWIIV
jgi:hypothetical protein